MPRLMTVSSSLARQMSSSITSILLMARKWEALTVFLSFSLKSWLCTRFRFERTLNSSFCSFSSSTAATFLCFRPRNLVRKPSLRMLMSRLAIPRL